MSVLMMDLPPIGELYYIAEWAIRLAMLAVVPFRRTPAAAASWLLLIFFLPVPGLVLFATIGSPRFPSWRNARVRQLRPFQDEIAGRMRDLAAPSTPLRQDIVDLAEKLGRLPAVATNAIEFCDDYDGVVARLVADIDGACRHVRILAYIFADDAIGRQVIAALGRAVRRGVICHVLLDPVGSHKWVKGTLLALQAQGVRVQEVRPFRLLRGRTRRDMRNHRKLYIIDGEIGYAGSQNIVSKDFRPGITNRELVVRVQVSDRRCHVHDFCVGLVSGNDRSDRPDDCFAAASGIICASGAAKRRELSACRLPDVADLADSPGPARDRYRDALPDPRRRPAGRY